MSKLKRRKKHRKPRAINITSDTMEVMNFAMTAASLFVEILIVALVAWEVWIMLNGNH